MPIMIPPGQGITVTTPVGQEQVAGMQQAQAMLPRTQQAPSPFREVHGPDFVIMPHEGEEKQHHPHSPHSPPQQQQQPVPQQQPMQQQPAQMSMQHPIKLDADSGAISDVYGFHKSHGFYGFPQGGRTPSVQSAPNTSTDWGSFRNLISITNNVPKPGIEPLTQPALPKLTSIRNRLKSRVKILPPIPKPGITAPMPKPQPLIYTPAIHDVANVNSSLNPTAITSSLNPSKTRYTDLFRTVMKSKATNYAKNSGVLTDLLKMLGKVR